MVVLRLALTHLEATPAPVIQDLSYQPIAMDAMVIK